MRVGGGEERHPFGDRSRAHEQFEEPLERADAHAALLFGLSTHGGLGVVAVDEPGGGLDQHPVTMSVEEDRQAWRDGRTLE